MDLCLSVGIVFCHGDEYVVAMLSQVIAKFSNVSVVGRAGDEAYMLAKLGDALGFLVAHWR